MELAEFQDNHYGDGEVYSYVDGLSFGLVDSSEDICGKYVTSVDVYHLKGTEEYFEVTQDRENCGYWGDGEAYTPTFRKVKRVVEVVEISKWYPFS